MQQFDFEVPVPTSLLLTHDPDMDPNTFASMLAERGSEFEYHEHVTIDIPLPKEEESMQEAIVRAFEVITRTSGLAVVEVIAGAASLYGKSVQGDQVAGLLKCNIQPEQALASLDIDLKSTEEGLLEGLVHELKQIQMV